MANTKEKTNGTAQRILVSADVLFCERGFDGVSMRDVAQHADVKKASLFYHFSNKEALFDRVLEQYYQAHREALSDAFDGEGTLRERIHTLMDAYLDFMADNRRYAQLVQIQVASGSIHRDLIDRNLRPLFDWIVEALSPVAPDTGPLSARQFYVTISGIVINYFTYAPVLSALWGEDPLSEPAREERRAHVHWLVDAFLDKLG